jgi:GTPase
MHCGVIRQAAQIKKIFFRDKLMNGDKGFVRFRFLYAPEYL